MTIFYEAFELLKKIQATRLVYIPGESGLMEVVYKPTLSRQEIDSLITRWQKFANQSSLSDYFAVIDYENKLINKTACSGYNPTLNDLETIVQGICLLIAGVGQHCIHTGKGLRMLRDIYRAFPAILNQEGATRNDSTTKTS